MDKTRELTRRLLEAVESNDLELCRELCLAGASLEPVLFAENKDEDLNDYPLPHAADLNHFEIVAYFLDSGVNPNKFFDLSALHYAASNGNLEMVRLLLKSGADIDLEDCS